MTKNLESRSLNGKLIDDGFEVIKYICNNDLPKELTSIMFDLVDKKYTDIRIVPGDIALENSSFRLEKPSHFVYVKENKSHRTYDKKSFYLVMPGLLHESGDYSTTIPLHTIR